MIASLFRVAVLRIRQHYAERYALSRGKLKYFQYASVVRRARASLGLKQRPFADLIDASPSSVQKWEAGQVHPSKDKLARIAQAVPAVAGEIEMLLANYEWHLENRDARECSELLALHMREALEIVIRDGQETVVKKVDEQLFKFARNYEMTFDAFLKWKRGRSPALDAAAKTDLLKQKA